MKGRDKYVNIGKTRERQSEETLRGRRKGKTEGNRLSQVGEFPATFLAY